MASAAARAKANAPAAPAGAPGEKPAAPPADKPADGASAAPADPAAVKSADTLAIEKWAAVERAAVAMLGSLSRQQFADLPAARTWLAHGGRAPDAWK
jgi:hypothetical protein